MALPRKLTERIYEIKAHTGDVTCLDVGETGRVLVTGGQDRNVNLWAIGQTECFMSLTGHNRPIDCVRFAYNDDFVYSADDIGIIRRWDLNAQTICSTLNGHMKSVRTLDFNPSGEYVVSGSNDTTVRLWDVRNQNTCMKVYRGHISHVNSVKFSPDGLWIASAGAEGSVIIWDIRKSKQIMEFCHQQQSQQQSYTSITCIRFHPFEFLLAVGRTDGTICIYDLETQLLLTQTDSKSLFYGHSIKCLTFSENGECLFVGTATGISVIGWEPDREFDHVKSNWTTLGDMKIVSRRLFCGSYDYEYVAIDALSVNRVFPFHNPSNIASTFVHNATARKSFSRGTQKLRLSIGGPKQSHLIEENEGNCSPNIDEHSSPNLSLELVDECSILNTDNVVESLTPPILSSHDDDTLIKKYDSVAGDGRLDLREGDFTSTYSSLGVNLPAKNNTASPPSQPASHHFITEPSSSCGGTFGFEGPNSLKMPKEHYGDIYQYNNYNDDLMLKTDGSYNDSFSPIISNYDHTEMVEDFPVNTNLHQPPSTSCTNGHVGTISTANYHSNSHNNHQHYSKNSKIKATTHTNKRTSFHVTTTTKSIHGNSTQQRPKLSQISSISTTDLHKMDDNVMLKKSASSHVVVHKTKAYINKEKENTRNKNQINVQIITKPPIRSRTSLELRLPSKEQQAGTDQRPLQSPQTHVPITYRPDPSLLTSTSNNTKNGKNRQSLGEITEIEILSSTHEQIYQELNNRYATLQLLRESTRNHDIMGAFKKAIQMGRTVFVDLLGAILEKTSSWSLDLCVLLLPEIYELLQSQHKFHYTRACDTLRVILYNFLPIIQDNLDPWTNGLGVDVTREERHRKCLECQRWLLQIRNLPESNHFASTTLTQLQNLIVNI